MRQRWFATITLFAAVVVLVVLVVLVGAPAAEASSSRRSRSIDVRPDTALVDGQTVTVSAHGFIQGGITRLLECDPSVGKNPSLAQALTSCVLGDFVTIGKHGNLPPTPFVVHTSGTAADGDPISCVAVDCIVMVGELDTRLPNDFFAVGTPIHFGSYIPLVERDCTHRGWRIGTTATGKHFRSLQQCVRYVKHHHA